MTTDERIDKLVERHEALTFNVELLTSDIRQLQESVVELRNSVSDLRIVARAALDGVGDLIRIARAHEHRIDRLERAS